MAYSPSQSIVLPSRPRTGRPFAALSEWLQPAKSALLARWRDYQAQRREVRALETIVGMDAHMLRDIGAPDELISHAAADRNSSPWREVLFQLAAIAVAIAVIGTPAPASAAEAANPQAANNAYARRPMPGVFTGEFVDGAPVYRFPAVVVIGSRGPDPAGSEPPMAQRRPAKATTARRPA